jgi:hypothetical protein
MATNALDVALEELLPSVWSVSPNGFNTDDASCSDGRLVLVGVGVGVGVLMSALVVCVFRVCTCVLLLETVFAMAKKMYYGYDVLCSSGGCKK